MRYCLECGYSRQGLPKDAVCPECGEADSFDKQREICTALVNKPLALLWRVMTLRRLPKGWWVVFENKRPSRFKPWLTICIGILILLTYDYLGQCVQIKTQTATFLYDTNDPQQSVIQEVSNRTDFYFLSTEGNNSEISYPKGFAQTINSNGSINSTIKIGKKRSTQLTFNRNFIRPSTTQSFIRFLLAYSIVVWLLSRFLWLPLIARDRCASVFRCAAQQTIVIFVAHVLWLIAISLLGFLLIIITSLSSVIALRQISEPYSILHIVAAIFCPTILWARLISTDNLKHEFPRRFSARLLLVGFTVLAAFAVFTWPWFW
ncbi:MAG: hypothetical protein IH984_13570 [Planctomycetes bacterium]|nr:hypothetical protein [Planctomycetota bacterium]